MRYRNLLHRLNQLTAEELEQPVHAYSPYFGREFEVVALGSKAAALGNYTDEESDNVLVLGTEPVE